MTPDNGATRLGNLQRFLWRFLGVRPTDRNRGGLLMRLMQLGFCI
jgi:hypothetical protein